MKYVLPHMMKAGGGSVINTASIAGLVAVRGGAAYAAAKAGVIALTRVAALEYGRYHIRVNALCPGAIETPMAQRIRKGQPPNPKVIERISVLGRMAEPEEIAKVALFLASEDASFATGAPFIIDGGMDCELTERGVWPIGKPASDRTRPSAKAPRKRDLFLEERIMNAVGAKE